MARDSCGAWEAIIAVCARKNCFTENCAAGDLAAQAWPSTWLRLESASSTRIWPPTPLGVWVTALGVYSSDSRGGMAVLLSTTVLMPSAAARFSSIA